MLKVAVCFALTLSCALAQYKAEPAGTPSPEIPGTVSAVLQKDGFRVSGADGKALLEVWFVNEMPKAAANSEENVTLNTIPHGAMLGVIRYLTPGADRRGQTIKPGTYLLRYSMFPITGDHQGVAPQRDFLVLTPADNDRDPTATPNYKALMDLSMKASGTPHPAVYSIWKAEGSATPGLAKEGEEDWVLTTKIGDSAISMIVFGKFEG